MASVQASPTAAVFRDRCDASCELTERLAIIVAKELDGVHELLDQVRALLAERAPAPAQPTPTVAYGSFLVATAAGGHALDLMTAMPPCAWRYADIGRSWAASASTHPVYPTGCGSSEAQSTSATSRSWDMAHGREEQ